MDFDNVRQYLPARTTALLAVLAFFGVFMLGVVIGHVTPEDPLTTFNPSNEISYANTDDTVYVYNVTLGRGEGASMIPTIWPGDTLLMQPYHDPGQVQEGDIVFYNASGMEGIHRVVAAYPSQNRLVVTGDNSNPNEEIQFDNIRYVVVGVLWT